LLEADELITQRFRTLISDQSYNLLRVPRQNLLRLQNFFLLPTLQFFTFI